MEPILVPLMFVIVFAPPVVAGVHLLRWLRQGGLRQRPRATAPGFPYLSAGFMLVVPAAGLIVLVVMGAIWLYTGKWFDNPFAITFADTGWKGVDKLYSWWVQRSLPGLIFRTSLVFLLFGSVSTYLALDEE